MSDTINKKIVGKISLASTRGFCAGVERAIEIVNRAIDKLGAPVYVRHEVVHNKFVVDALRDKGAVFVRSLDNVPNGKNVVFSAHGVPVAVREKAKDKNLQIFDATCPLVTKVHLQVKRYADKGMDVILIGHAGHPEVEGTLGQLTNKDGQIYLVETTEDVQNLKPKNQNKLAYVSQTTLSIDDTKKIVETLIQKFPHIKSPGKDDICYATQNRQNAVRQIVKKVDLMLIVGSPNSSNSNRLCELAEKMGVESHLIDNATEIDNTWFSGVSQVGVSSGASAPEILVQQVIDLLEQKGLDCISDKSRTNENMKFPLPLALRFDGS